MDVIGSQRDLNVMRDVESFLAAWDDAGHPYNTRHVVLRSTAFGEVNDTGRPGTDSGKVLTRWHPSFPDALEPGVRELVLLLIERFGWITFSACEGHAYEGLDVEPVERVVCLLPRDEAERVATIDRLAPALARVNGDGAARVRPALVAEVLRSKSSSARYPVLDLRFTRTPGTAWPDYFSAVDRTYAAVLSELTSPPAAP
jgi:uncharacterized protein